MKKIISVWPKYYADSVDSIILAKNNLEYIEGDLKDGHWDPACFWSQQVAEHALKGYLFHLGKGLIKKHRLTEDILPLILRHDQAAAGLTDCCRYLDRFYIETRYPVSGRPEGGFTEKDAQKAYRCAQKIFNYVNKNLPKSVRKG